MPDARGCHVYQQLQQVQSLLPSRQSAYRAQHSTETAIIAVRDEIISAIDSGKVCALVLLDLSSAFDTVDHGILPVSYTHLTLPTIYSV